VELVVGGVVVVLAAALGGATRALIPAAGTVTHCDCVLMAPHYDQEMQQGLAVRSHADGKPEDSCASTF
jgi:hypothetical protein